MKQQTQIVIRRDGQLDPEYLALLQRQERHQKLLSLGHGTLHILKAITAYIVVKTGITILECYAGMLDGLYGTNELADLKTRTLS